MACHVVFTTSQELFTDCIIPWMSHSILAEISEFHDVSASAKVPTWTEVSATAGGGAAKLIPHSFWLCYIVCASCQRAHSHHEIQLSASTVCYFLFFFRLFSAMIRFGSARPRFLELPAALQADTLGS
eukprot:61021_1